MEIEIWSGKTKAIVDSQGAYLTNLSDEVGDIIFPKRTITAPGGSKKTRGGIHVCMPNFGPGGSSGQPQHGYGREMKWEVSDTTDGSVLLTLAKGVGEYVNLAAVLTYQLSDRQLLTTLELVNNGTSGIRVAPAFHPYFYAANDEVTVDSEKKEKALFEDAVFESRKEHTLQQADRTITIASDNLPVWALWTDSLGKYFCIEPTADGFSFLNDDPKTGEMLAGDDSRVYQMTINW